MPLTSNPSAGGGGGGGCTCPAADYMLLKDFFDQQGLLPPTTLIEELYDYPARDFSNLNGGTLAINMSRGKFTPAVNSVANWGWDIGSLKGTILCLIGMARVRNSDLGIFIGSAAPGATEIADGSYLADFAAGGISIYKYTGGTFTQLGTDASIGPPDTTGSPSFALGFYYDDATNRLIAFARVGSECWFPVVDLTDSSFTTMRYVGIRIGPVGAPIYWSGTPIAIYTS